MKIEVILSIAEFVLKLVEILLSKLGIKVTIIPIFRLKLLDDSGLCYFNLNGIGINKYPEENKLSHSYFRIVFRIKPKESFKIHRIEGFVQNPRDNYWRELTKCSKIMIVNEVVSSEINNFIKLNKEIDSLMVQDSIEIVVPMCNSMINYSLAELYKDDELANVIFIFHLDTKYLVLYMKVPYINCSINNGGYIMSYDLFDFLDFEKIKEKANKIVLTEKRISEVKLRKV